MAASQSSLLEFLMSTGGTSLHTHIANGIFKASVYICTIYIRFGIYGPHLGFSSILNDFVMEFQETRVRSCTRKIMVCEKWNRRDKLRRGRGAEGLEWKLRRKKNEKTRKRTGKERRLLYVYLREKYWMYVCRHIKKRQLM